MNLLTNFWTGDLKGLTKEGARIVDSLVEHVTKGLRTELAESNRLLELANAPEKALEDALTVAEIVREQLEKAKRPAQEGASG